MPSPTQRTLDYLREQGQIAAVVEHWNSFTHKRSDLFGFADIISFDESHVTLWQATSGSNVSSRLKKIAESEAAAAWVKNPACRIMVIGWTKYAKPINRKRWRPRIVEVT